MKRRGAGLSRRGFLRATSGLAVGGLAGLVREDAAHAEEPIPTERAERSRVVLVRNPDAARPAEEVAPQLMSDMLNEAMASLMQKSGPEEAWRALFSAEDVVGLKTNVWSNLRTPRSLEDAIRDELLAIGISDSNIEVDDRGVRTNAVFRRATALVNVRPMRTHHWSGLGTCLKNMIMFVPRPADYHGDTCASLGAIWQLPELAGKVRLNILVLLTPQFHGLGPHSFSGRFTWPYGGLLLGIDPVAVDATGARIIQAKRTEYFGEARPISPPPHHIEIADTRYGLGNSNRDKIDLIQLGWTENSLIG